MQPELQSLFDAAESQRTTLSDKVLALSDAQRSEKTNAATWSIQQIVEHLVLSDETVGRAQDAGTVANEASMFRAPLLRFIPRVFRRALVIRAFERDMVLPLPSPAVEPHGDVPLPALLERWETARGEMRRALDSRGNELRYSHPVLGPLTAAQMLRLAQAHTAYHLRQIEAFL